MKFRSKTVTELAEMICGNPSAREHFNYRTGRELDDFFEDAGADEDYWRDLPGLSRRDWAESILEQILAEPWLSSTTPSETFARAIALLMDQEDAKDEPSDRPGALALLNRSLNRENLDAFYGPEAVLPPQQGDRRSQRASTESAPSLYYRRSREAGAAVEVP